MTSRSKTLLALLLLAPVVVWAWMGGLNTLTSRADTSDGAIQREHAPVELAASGERADQRVTSGQDRTPESSEVRISRPPSVFGTVTDEPTGEPIIGAHLSLFALGAQASVKVTSDRQGRFSFPTSEDASTSFVLSASLEGYGSFTDRAVFASAEPLELKLAPELFLRGQVVRAPEDRPVSSFRVVAIRVPDPGTYRPFWHSSRIAAALPEDFVVAQESEFANADGHFELGGLRAGKYVLVVSAPDYAPVVFDGKRKKTQGRPVVASPPDQAEPHLIRLAEMGTMYVKMLDAQTGRVIEGAEVALESKHRGRFYQADPSEHTRESDGRLRFAVPLGHNGRIGDVRLRVSATGYVPYTTNFSGQEDGWTLTMELGQGGRVHGTVLDNAGIPLQDAAVFVNRSFDGRLMGFARTDAQGFYKCGSLPGGSAMDLYCLDPTLRETLAEAPVLLEHGEDRTIDIGGSRSRGIFGRVTSMGEPVAEASVALYLRNGSTSDTTFRTGASGRYEFVGLVPGDYELTLYLQGSEVDFDEERLITYAAGESVEENFEYTLQLLGRLVDTSTGSPFQEGETFRLGVQLVGGVHTGSRTVAYSNESSELLLPVREAGVYEVTLVRGDGYSMPPTRVTVEEAAPAETVDLHLTPGAPFGELAIRLFDKESGAAIIDGWCEFSSAGGSGWASADEGVILLDELDPETVSYRLAADGHVPQRGKFDIKPDLGPQSIDAHLARSNAVRVTQVHVGGRASQAGLQLGDVIRRVGETAVLEKTTLHRAFKNTPRDQALELQVDRSGGVVTLPMRGGPLEMEIENCRVE